METSASPRNRNWFGLVLLGLTVGVSSGLFGIGGGIIILPALAVIFDGYKVPKSYFVLVPIMIFGVILTGGIFDAPPSEGPATVYGVNIAIMGTILGATSGVCYGIYLYASRKASTVNPGRIIQPMLYTCIAQLVAPAIFAFGFRGGLDFTNGVLTDGVLVMDNPNQPLSDPIVGDPITWENWMWMLVLAVVGQAIAWTFVQYGSVRMDTTVVAGLLLLSPIATVAFIAPVMFNEQPSMLQWIGVVVVLAAVAYQNKLPQALMAKMRGDRQEVPES